jgi:3-oxoadipate enol-lactonase
VTAVDHFAAGMAWREAGAGDPLLFLHGLGGTRLAWEPQLEGLSDRWRCIAWDLPGYGASEALPELTFPAIADAIVRLLDYLELERAHVVGLSFGGQQAMHLALDHADRVGRLVLTDTSHRFGDNGTDPDEWKQLRLGAIDAGLTPADIAPYVIESIAGPDFSGRELERTVAAFGHITANAFRAAVGCLPSHDVADRLGAITAPTLVVVGALDDETPVEYAEFIADAIPGARLAIVPDAGHLTPAERPERFNALVRDFLTNPG